MSKIKKKMKITINENKKVRPEQSKIIQSVFDESFSV
jgi:hypothetical protein